MNEIKNMEICGENNENSVKYYESYQTEKEFAIVLELCDESLSSFKKIRNFSSKEIYEILNQLNNTFKIMKEKTIVHRDLKPDNILIKHLEDNKFIIKLCDYGISKIGNFTKLKTYAGTAHYMAPEIIVLTEDNTNYTYKCDLWSLGIIIYELFFKERPYKGKSEYAILEKIKNFGKSIIKKTGDDILDDLISKLLEINPERRMSWDEYFNHPFFKMNEITIIYKNIEKGNKIRIFGEKFVENNKNKCKIKYKDEIFDLKEFLDIQKDEDIFEIKLIGINNVTNMSYMFNECFSLVSLPDISRWNTNKVTDMSFMFTLCESLKILDDISEWNTNNVTNMSYMFYDCYSLESLPDISKWNTSKVTDMSSMFTLCESLKILPDISKWNINNVSDMKDIFSECNFSLKNLNKFIK